MRTRYLLGASVALAMAFSWADAQAQWFPLPTGPGSIYFGVGKNICIPLILKGIGTGEDAAIACEHGVDVVYVSNHGGRQLDHGRGSMDVLPEVMNAVRGRARVPLHRPAREGLPVRVHEAEDRLGAGHVDPVRVGHEYAYRHQYRAALRPASEVRRLAVRGVS